MVDAKNEQARNFYERYGFVGLAETSDRLFLPMKTAEKLLKSTN